MQSMVKSCDTVWSESIKITCEYYRINLVSTCKIIRLHDAASHSLTCIPAHHLWEHR